MWRKAEQKILQIKKAAGVEIIFLEGDKYYININQTISRNNAIINEKEIHSLERIEQIEGQIAKDIPLSIVLNGKGILLKKIVGPASNGLLQSVIPNANPDDFYYDLIGIARRETINSIITELKQMGYKIISVSLGLSVLPNILPFIKQGMKNELESDSLLIQIDNNEITSFSVKDRVNNNKYQPREYLVANQYVKPANILSFAAAAGLFADDIRSANPMNAALLNEERKEYRSYRLFRFAVIGFLTSLFALLLINFFIYNHYFIKNRDLQTSSTFLSEQNQSFQQLSKDVKRKEKFLNQVGWTSMSRTSFYADRIAGLAPPELMFTNLQIYPARSNFLSDAAGNIFKKDTIALNGICGNPVDLSLFVNNLKILADFKTVTIKSYQYRSEIESGSFQMELITQ